MPAGIYIHIPFCRSRCSYCDFATDVFKNEETVERYVSALVKEINSFETQSLPLPILTSSPIGQSPVLRSGDKNSLPFEGGVAEGRGGYLSTADTIYFGGGTPSLLSPKQLEKILSAVHDKFEILPGAEITMEMNPATVTPETLSEYRSLGINRASFGAQTFDDTELKRLGRKHTAADVRETIEMLRAAGFDNTSFDLIAGLPRQTLADWERNLDEALKLAPEHISLYLLEVHEGTPLAEQIRSGRQPLPDEDLSAEMYETMLEKTSAAGYGQYEISNFSRPGYESRHNSKYWTFDPYYSFGCSAHSFDGVSKRWANERDTAAYVNLIEKLGTAISETTELDEKAQRAEYAFLRLRLNEGINLADYRAKFGKDLNGEFGLELENFIREGLLESDKNSLRLTRKGSVYSNEVFAIFV